MAKMNQAFRILTLSLFLLVIPAFAQQEKPPESYDDAMEAFMKADYKSAVDHFRQAIAERPSMVRAHYFLGLSLYFQQNYGEALSAYQELVQLDPDNILAHYQLAKIHLTIEDFRPAVEEYRWLVSLSKRRSEMAVVSGDLLPDKPGGAINDWQKQQAGELAQYLLDMIPRNIGDQYELPASQTVYSIPSSALSCLKSAPQQGAAADSNPKRISPAPGDLILTPKIAGVIPVRDPQGVPASPTKPAYPARQDGNSATLPMTANLRPTILYREKAKYTEVARINKSQGTVVLSVVFNVEGKVTDIRVIRCLPDGLLQNAIKAAQNIRFNPAIKNGTPVSVRGQLEFSYNLY
jgi:TonB family protein